MKNRICLAFLLMATAFYTTKADEITFNPVTFEPGGQAELVIEANLTNANLTSYQFDIYFPEGISVAYDEDEEDYVYSLSGRHKKDHTLSLQEHSEYGFWRFIVSSNSNKLIRSGEGELLTLTLQASPAASGTHTVQVKNIKMAEPDQTSHVLNNTSFNLVVNSVVVNASSISLDKTTLLLTSAEQTSQLTATVLPANATNKTVMWSSSNNDVATVDSDGLVTAKTNGTATITATTADGTNLSATCQVAVNIPTEIKATSISLDKTTLSLSSVDQTSQLTATVLPTNATNKSVTWTSSNTSVATVDANGLVTAKAEGTATITATTTDGTNLNVTCEVAVNTDITGITEGYYYIVSAGKGPGYYTTAKPENPEKYNDEMAYGMYNADGFVNWGYFDYTQKYVYKFEKAEDGNWNIKNIADNSYIEKGTSNYGQKVSTSETPTMTQEISLVTEGKFAITWSKSRTGKNVYSLTASHNGSKNGDAEPGTISVWGTAAEAAKYGVNVWYLIPVGEVKVSSISLDKAMLELISIGQTSQLLVTVLPTNATNKSVTWTSSNTSVATVDANGLVTAKANGTATITATTADGTNLSATCEVTVDIPVLATSISLDKTTLLFSSTNQLSQLTATVLPTNATNNSVTWSSSDVNVVTVYSTGVVVPKANGTANITATTNDGTNLSATCQVTVYISSDSSVYKTIEMVTERPLAGVTYAILNAETNQFLSCKYGSTGGMQESLSSSDMLWQIEATGKKTMAGYDLWYLKSVGQNLYVQEVNFEDPANEGLDGYDIYHYNGFNWELTDNKAKAAKVVIEKGVGLVDDDIVDEKWRTAGPSTGFVISRQNLPIWNGAWNGSEIPMKFGVIGNNVAWEPWNENVAWQFWTVEKLKQATSVSVNKESLSFTAAGQTSQLTATVLPTNATNKSVAWSSSNTSVATVSSNGVVTSKGYGTATITAKTTDGSNKSATCSVTVVIPKYTLKFVADGTVVSEKSVDYGSAITAPNAPAKTGYTFVSWGNVAATMPANDVTYTAQYKVNKYKVTFNVDGKVYKTFTQNYGTAIVAPQTPTKEGYTFSCWKDIASTVPAHDVTYEAIFTINKYKLKFVADGTVVSEKSVDYGSAITAPNAPAKTGYTFVSWGNVAATMPAKDVTYTAQYKVNQYKLTYMIDGRVYKTYTLDYNSVINPEGDAEDDDYYYGWEDIPNRMPDHDVTVNAYITGIAAAGVGLSNHKYEIYTIDGKKLNNLQKGINIIRTADGKTKKVVVK